MAKKPALKPLPEDWSRGLAIVAHPDDLEYGAASAVHRWTSQGKRLAYVLITSGEAGIDTMAPGQVRPIREAEQRASASEVGVEVVDFLGYADGTIEYGLPLRRDVARSIRRHEPEVVISLNYRLTWGGTSANMADHRAAGMAVLDGARDAGNRWIFPELKAAGHEPFGGVRMVCFAGSPEPTHAVDITGHLETGIRSLKAHKTYLDGLGGDFDPEAFLRKNAEATGKQLGCEHAVAFEVFEL